MTDGTLLVNFGALMQAASDIDKAIKTLQSQLSQLDSDARPLVSTWSGSAMQAYSERQARWTSASEDLQHILQSIKAAVHESAQDYQHTERQAQSRFQ
jgi:6 kDa early secretory antigenic target